MLVQTRPVRESQAEVGFSTPDVYSQVAMKQTPKWNNFRKTGALTGNTLSATLKVEPLDPTHFLQVRYKILLTNPVLRTLERGNLQSPSDIPRRVDNCCDRCYPYAATGHSGEIAQSSLCTEAKKQGWDLSQFSLREKRPLNVLPILAPTAETPENMENFLARTHIVGRNMKQKKNSRA